MTKVIAYTALHYGRDYLASAIRSVIDAVDEFHFIYTPVGSHGHRSAIPCPESREELYEIARQASGAKFHWHEGTWAFEGAQRDSIMQYAPDSDVILVVDADEVWSTGLTNFVTEHPTRYSGLVSRFRLPMVHYWRSFYRSILHDPAYPERVIYPKVQQGATLTLTELVVQSSVIYNWEQNTAELTQEVVQLPPIHHFGYAQHPEIVEYKQHVHGHKGEWRKDDWFNGIFMNPHARTDLHPVGSEYWNWETVDPFALGLPEWMHDHPFAKLEVIE